MLNFRPHEGGAGARARSVGALALLLGAWALAGVLEAQDRETAAQRAARQAGEFLGQVRDLMAEVHGFHFKGTFRSSNSADAKGNQTITFNGTACGSVAKFTLKAPMIDPKKDLDAYKGPTVGVVHVDDKTGWVEFGRLPDPWLNELVQSPQETLATIFMAAVSAEASSTTEKVGKTLCRVYAVGLSDYAIQSVLPRFETPGSRNSLKSATCTARLWVGEDARVCRLALQYSMVFTKPPEGGEEDDAAPGIGGIGSGGTSGGTEGKPAGLFTLGYEIQMEFSRYDEDVDFKAPPEVERRLR